MKNDDKPHHHKSHAPICCTRKSDGYDKTTKGYARRSNRVANFPLERVELKRFQVDVMLCGDETGYILGRPWITIAVDAYSRMVVGHAIDFDSPSGSAAGVCMSHSILPKEEWLQQNEAIFQGKLEWPCQGWPYTLCFDNFREFGSSSLLRTYDRYGVRIEFGYAKNPERTGCIEHLVSRMAKRLSGLSKLISSHSNQRDGSDGGDGKSAIGWQDFKRWLTVLICGIYHNRSHSDLDGKSPLERWKQGSGDGVESALSSVACPDCYVGADTEQLRIDFLPSIERVITWDGVQIDAVRYMGSALQPWINTRHPKDENRLRLFTFRRDPQDISVIYFWNPELEKYEPVPCRDGFQCSMTIWEWRAFVKHQITTSKVRPSEEIKAMILDLIRKM